MRSPQLIQKAGAGGLTGIDSCAGFSSFSSGFAIHLLTKKVLIC